MALDEDPEAFRALLLFRIQTSPLLALRVGDRLEECPNALAIDLAMSDAETTASDHAD